MDVAKALESEETNMKSKLIVGAVFTAILGMSTLFATSAHAGGNHYNHHNRHYYQHRHNNWVAPLIIGGAVGYVLTRPTYVAPPPPPPVYYTQPYYAPAPVCTRYVYQDQYGNVQSEEIRCN